MKREQMNQLTTTLLEKIFGKYVRFDNETTKEMIEFIHNDPSIKWDEVSKDPNLNYATMQEFINLLDWAIISKFQLPILRNICCYQKLSDPFLKKVLYAGLSINFWEFMNTFQRFPSLSKKFLSENSTNFDTGRWPISYDQLLSQLPEVNPYF